MNKHAAENPIWYPWQRVIRTAAQYVAGTIIGVAAALAVLVVVAPQVLDAIREFLSPEVYAWLVGAIAFCAAASAALAKIMAIPQINDWLTKHTPLGSAPRNTDR